MTGMNRRFLIDVRDAGECAAPGKLFGHRRARRRWLARALPAELERVAVAREIALLVMDTRKGGDAERLCESLGYTRWGEVPEYARSGDGGLHTTVFYYRRLLAIQSTLCV